MNAMLPGLPRSFAVLVEPQDLPDRIKAACRRINWVGVACSLVLQGAFLAVLISMGVVAVGTKREALTVLDMRQESPPPAAAAPPSQPQRDIKPVVQPQPKTDIVAPPPKIDLQPVTLPVTAAVEAPAPAPAAAPAANVAPAAPSAGSGPVSVANLSTNLLSTTAPSYPMVSRRKREQGAVVLRLVISPEGRVTGISVSRSSGFAALDEAAMAAVRKWRWAPLMREGRAVAFTGEVTIPFNIKEG